MKRNLKSLTTSLTAVLLASTIIFYACEKTKDAVMDFTEIDKVSADIADFHTYAMTKILNEVHLYEDIEGQNCIEKLNNFIEEEMLNYDFKYLNFDAGTAHFPNTYDYAMYQKICSTIEKGYDFSAFSTIENTPISNAKNMVIAMPAVTFSMATVNNRVVAPNYNLIDRKCQNIENKMSSLVTMYDDFGQLKTAYLKYVAEELKDVTTTNDYVYLRNYADVFISSFEYWIDYYKNGTKGKFKDIWNKVKEGVIVDATGAVVFGVAGAVGGAVVGSMAGGVGAGPGAAAGVVGGAITGAIGSSGMYAVDQIRRTAK